MRGPRTSADAAGLRGLALGAALALGLIAIAVGAFPSAVGAQVCSGDGAIFDRSGEVDALCELGRPDRDGIYRGITEEDRWNAYCTFFMEADETLTYEEGAMAVINDQGRMSEERVERRGFNPTGVYGWFTVSCIHPDGTGFGGEFEYTITDPISIDDLLAEVKERIEIDDPIIESNPSFNERFAVVRIPTWLWVDADHWNEVHDETETRGFVTVEVWAEPEDLEWTFTGGDPEIDCPNGPGTPWTFGAGDPDCSVLFRQSSAGQADDAFGGEATVFWQFYWTLNGADQGPFDELLELTTDFQIEVGEIQSVES